MRIKKVYKVNSKVNKENRLFASFYILLVWKMLDESPAWYVKVFFDLPLE